MSVEFREWQDLLSYLRWHLEKERLIIEVQKNPEPLIKIVLD